MKKALIVVAVILAVLAVVYLGASWYFSGLIVAFTPNSLAEERLKDGDPQDYGLPAPEEITFQGDGETLAGWYFDNPV
ncbi:MAG: dipeptidyl aminopeptidase, partial [Anaerolineae bacterium]|nr:dipeptidyl aminopeptidase [Anaerolineae bacterium]